MLRLFFHFDGVILKVRKANPGEVMITPVCWKNRIEFDVQDSTLMLMSWTSLLPDLAARDAEALLNLVSARYPVSHDFDELSRLCPRLVVGLEADEWVFFGGSFNPWHEGHQACLSLLSSEKTCFVVPDRSPHKNMDLAAVPLIISLSVKIKFGRHQFLVPTFMLDPKKNPTVDWIERLRDKYPEKKLSLLIGFDSLKNISTWTRAQALLPLLSTLYVASRLETDDDQKNYARELQTTAPKLTIDFIGHHEYERSSSSKLRQIYGGPMKFD